jgi:23S rRNA (uracil1939-C5)-methyltransferase
MFSLHYQKHHFIFISGVVDTNMSIKLLLCVTLPGGVYCGHVPLFAHVETVVQLVRKKPDTYLDVKIDMSKMDATSAETAATYQKIKNYIQEKHGVKVSSLYIAQVKEKVGIKERECFNKVKSENVIKLQCPETKEELIMDALVHFQMI